jgi:hypothetical protein
MITQRRCTLTINISGVEHYVYGQSLGGDRSSAAAAALSLGVPRHLGTSGSIEARATVLSAWLFGAHY